MMEVVKDFLNPRKKIINIIILGSVVRNCGGGVIFENLEWWFCIGRIERKYKGDPMMEDVKAFLNPRKQYKSSDDLHQHITQRLSHSVY